MISDSEANEILRECEGCSASRPDGCVKFHFMDKMSNVDFNKSISVVKECHRIVATKDNNENCCYIMDQFKLAITKQANHKVTGAVVFSKMDYRIGACREIEVCRKCFYKAYGISHHMLDRISNELKEHIDESEVVTQLASSNIATVTTLVPNRMWKDNHIHNFTYKETEQLFIENLGSGGTGRRILAFYLW